MAMITCEDVWKSFRRHSGQKLLRNYLSSGFRSGFTKFEALKGISFSVEQGESLAIIGGNGAGKSTLLSVVTGLTRPDKGSVKVNGRLVALLELGSGFHPDLTGAENVYLNAAILGFTRKRTNEIFDSIVEFAGVGDFINEPLRTYSNGMNLRLAFSVAVSVDPDVLIVDEVLAVGDQDFQVKCHERIRSFRKSGKTFICVSHSKAILQDLCDRAIWLDHGQMMMAGEISRVLDAYEGRVPA